MIFGQVVNIENLRGVRMGEGEEERRQMEMGLAI